MKSAESGSPLPRKPATADCRVTLARMQAQQDALQRLSTSTAFASFDVVQLAREITRIASSTVGVERANVWLFNQGETQLRCIDLYEATPRRHSAGMVLSEADYGNEFAALKDVSYVAADEPLSDPRTAGYVSGYLAPLRISSMLDALIQFAGQRIGLLCLEHVDEPHHWETDEINFACHLADKLALVAINSSRNEALATLAASESRYRSILEASPDGIAITDLEGRVTMASPMAETLLGAAGADNIVGRLITDFIVPDDRKLAAGRLAALFSGVKTGPAEYRGLRLDGGTFHIEVNAEFVGRAGSRPAEVVFIVRDISERKRSQEALHQSLNLLRTVP